MLPEGHVLIMSHSRSLITLKLNLCVSVCVGCVCVYTVTHDFSVLTKSGIKYLQEENVTLNFFIIFNSPK